MALVERARSPRIRSPRWDARVLRYEQAIDRTRETHRALQQEIAVLQSRIQQEEGGGIEEQIATAERRREDFARERDALRREAEVLAVVCAAPCWRRSARPRSATSHPSYGA